MQPLQNPYNYWKINKAGIHIPYKQEFWHGIKIGECLNYFISIWAQDQARKTSTISYKLVKYGDAAESYTKVEL